MAKLIKDRVGEISYSKSGEKMTIIAYRGFHDMDVQFENGYIKHGVNYDSFKKGSIRRSMVGDVGYSANGEKATVIDYKSKSDLTIQFEDGTIRTGITSYVFRTGRFSKTPSCSSVDGKKDYASLRVGEVVRSRSGELMKIIAYRKFHDIDVEFEDGTKRLGVSYASFRCGRISKVARASSKKD